MAQASIVQRQDGQNWQVESCSIADTAGRLDGQIRVVGMDRPWDIPIARLGSVANKLVQRESESSQIYAIRWVEVVLGNSQKSVS